MRRDPGSTPEVPGSRGGRGSGVVPDGARRRAGSGWSHDIDPTRSSAGRPGRRTRRPGGRRVPASPATRSATSAGCAARTGPQDRRRRRRPGPAPRHRPRHPAGGVRGARVLRRRRPAAVRRRAGCWCRPRTGTAPGWPSTSAAAAIALVLVAGFAALFLVLGDSWGGRRGSAGRWSWPGSSRCWCWPPPGGRAAHRRPPAPAAGRAGPPAPAPPRATAPPADRPASAGLAPAVRPPSGGAGAGRRRARRDAAGRSCSGSRWRWSRSLEGVLGIVDVAGARVADSAYPALAVGIIARHAARRRVLRPRRRAGAARPGRHLVLAGVHRGRALGRRRPGARRPPTAAGVQDTYQISAGELVLDLRRCATPAPSTAAPSTCAATSAGSR